MTLTDDQKELLSQIVQVYESGCKGEFILVASWGEPNRLVYGGHPDVVVRANIADFRELAQEGLITLSRSGRGDYTGKPTGKGVAVLKSLASAATDPIEPLGSRHKWVGLTDAANAGPDDRSAAGRMVAAKQLLSGSGPETSGAVIFIGHGRSKEWLALEKFLTMELHLNCEEFSAKPPAGYTTQAHLDKILNRATFAFLVMTAEDTHHDGTLHARENVIHEAGLFQGKLGFPHAVLLVETGCSLPSNFDGLTHIPFPKNSIGAAFHDVRRTLEDRRILPSH